MTFVLFTMIRLNSTLRMCMSVCVYAFNVMDGCLHSLCTVGTSVLRTLCTIFINRISHTNTYFYFPLFACSFFLVPFFYFIFYFCLENIVYLSCLISWSKQWRRRRRPGNDSTVKCQRSINGYGEFYLL